MKEIIYIQAGPLANYTGQHFWNTQEAYFTYDEEESASKEEPLTDHDVSFREGLSPSASAKGEPTYCPRLLAFDWKGNFGTLRADLYGDAGEDKTVTSLWNGDVVEFRQDPIPRSQYHKELENESMDHVDNDVNSSTHVEGKRQENGSSDIRFWADYSRVYYHPRSLHKLPEPAEWQDTAGDWNYGQDLFTQYDQDNALIDDSLRHFMEECDALQGIHVMNDTSCFGSFTDSMLTMLKDDHPKLSCIVVPFLSGEVKMDALESDAAMRVVINDALYLRNLRSYSTLSVPIQSPSTWANVGAWMSDLTADVSKLYHTSAVLSSHIESVTLPLRMKGGAIDLRDFCNSVAYPTNVPFAHLSGILPLSNPIAESMFDERMHDFSRTTTHETSAVYARRDTTRGFSRADRQLYDAWQEKSGIPFALYDITHAPALPLPTSFPPIINPSLRIPPATPDKKARATTYSTRCLSSLYATSVTSRLFSSYASFVEDCVKRKKQFKEILGMEVDEIKELASELWMMHDAYHGEDEIEDEEFQDVSDEED
ncbi:tubulin nucleotide-binding domain-like protein [Gloeophyllum trabeum ATCC 11539]|uniref:Tubulin nucleotide-binding domain-like protein n=1 Tax=Gloeophyllum trabeum (strain ATCC 11539 / FP-39264 / Madison 617) TaxID=670483 RepID=S7RRJ8_GLOTA|nr:tubulin nucleotide-binding domain-like protein [Gloeophyllum trabeum ATCC 11539]EPQ55584.1 tubulin nucleotide-binding domain-like protein [Gloeophyllum trabeum ATCC 11539]